MRPSYPAFVLILIACGGDGPTSENEAPRVLSLSPPAWTTNVEPTASISARFSKAIDGRTANATTFALTADGTPIRGIVSLEGRVLRFEQSSPLAYATTFTARLSTGIEDVAGVALAAPVEWNFTTMSNPAPEHVSPRPEIGVTVEGEEIDEAGDRDEFHLTGAEDDEWIIFIQSRADVPGGGGGVQLIVLDSASGDVVAGAAAPSNLAELEQSSTGRFELPRTGAYVIRVSGHVEAEYRFRVDVVHRTPEASPATIAVGDTIGEAIDAVGDVDEFTFEATAGQEVTLLLQLQSGMSEGLTLELSYGGAILRRLETRVPTAALEDFGATRITLPGRGPYTVRIAGPPRGPVKSATGSYRFELYPIDRAPENAAVVSLDAPPIVAAIERPGDVDQYDLAGVEGQLVVIRLETAGPGAGHLIAYLSGEDGTRYATANTGGHADGGLWYSRRIALPRTGAYRLLVQGRDDVALSSGPYTLEAYTVSTAPEHVPATVPIGGVVTDELIDRPGDLDVFTFEGEAGREVNIFLGWEQSHGDLFAHMGFGMFTRAGTIDLDGQSTGRFEMKDSTYTITIDPHWAAQAHTMNARGAYAFRVFPIDRRPEGRSADYIVGDTVSGEPLYPAGDIDEYMFDLGEETTLDIHWDAPFTGPDDAVSGVLYDERTGGSVWGSFSTHNGELIRRITLPAGRYRLSVLNWNITSPGNQFLAKLPTLSYRFAFHRQHTP